MSHGGDTPGSQGCMPSRTSLLASGPRAQSRLAIAGVVLVYRDSDHLTHEYVATTVPHLEPGLRESRPQVLGAQPS